jgi:PAS domain S-box-containing protein
MRARTVLLAVLVGCPVLRVAAEEAPWRVLILHGSDALVPSVIVFDQAMRAALAERSPRPIELFTEALDLVRFGGAEYEPDLVAFYRKKYQNRSPDLVLAVGYVALRFAGRHRDEMWPGTPIVFSSVPDDLIRGFPLPPRTTGSLIRFDVAGTLNLAERLQPAARRVVVVGGVSNQDDIGIQRVTDELARRAGPLSMTVLSEMTLQAILDEVGRLPPDSIVFYASLLRDAAGRHYSHRDIATRLTTASKAPVYSMSESCLGLGIVGGYMTNLEAHGHGTAALALRVLAGEKPEAIPVQAALATVPRVDWRQLQRWGMDERLLPAGTDVVHRRPSLWEHYRGVSILVILTLAALVTLVTLLLISRAKRIRSEHALPERLRFERLVSELSATLIDVPDDRVNAEIERALGKVLQAMDLDLCGLFVNSPREGWSRISLQAEAPGIPALPKEWREAQAPIVFEQIRGGKIVALSDVSADLPAHAVAEREVAERLGLKSLLLIPVTVSDDIVRGVMFLSMRKHRPWPADLVSRLRLVGDILVSTVVGKRAEAALRTSEVRYREVVESQTDLICRFLPDTTLTFVNQAYCRYFGRSREELIGRRFLELLPVEARETAQRHVESLIESPRVEVDEHEVLRPDGSIGWQQWLDYGVRGRDGRIVEFQGIGRDITDRKRAEEANRNLAHAARLSLLGELTASIAHEINQPLGAILANADAADMLLESGNGKPEEVRAILADIRREDVRASEVIRHVRSLVRRREIDRQPLDLNQVASDVLRLASPDATRRGVSVVAQFDAQLPVVRGDRMWLEQVLLNLVLNGMDAMGNSTEGGRCLTVQTMRNGHQTVEVAVRDTGHGISASVLPRLFESFVTTRENGMGLGLSISRSIVEAHGGTIRAENNPGGGATFRFTLPLE